MIENLLTPEIFLSVSREFIFLGQKSGKEILRKFIFLRMFRVRENFDQTEEYYY